MEKGKDQISKTMRCDLLPHPQLLAAIWLLSEQCGIPLSEQCAISKQSGPANSDRYLAWGSTILMYAFGPCAGVVAGMAVQQRMQTHDEHEAAIQWETKFGRVFITLRLWLFIVFISQFAIALLFLTIQLFAVESHLNFLLAKRYARYHNVTCLECPTSQTLVNCL